MKVLIQKSLLETIVINTNPYLEKRDLSAITSHILFTADEILKIKATDHEIGLSYKVTNIAIKEKGEATANGKKLLDVIKCLKDEEVTLETIGNYLYIKQKGSKYKLPMYNSKDFPVFPEISNKNKFDINASTIGRGLKKIIPCIGTNNPKMELNGSLIDINEECINLVSTDTKRLALYKLDIKGISKNELIIPKKAIVEMQKLFSDKIEIFYDENILLAVSDKFEFFTKLINGKFVDYNKLLRNQPKISFNLNRDKFLEGMKTISIGEQTKITFKSNEILFESISDDNSEAKTEIQVEIPINEEISVKFKNKFIIDFLTSIEEPEFTFKYQDVGLFIELASGNLKTIIMPLN